ncbi:hypothetical protein MBLNU230_g7655t1 [Neophaeotheca triangularis]
MRFFFQTTLVSLLAAFAMATQDNKKSVIVSYDKDTPSSVMETAMEHIRQAGGVITHEYTIIKGFAADTSAEALENVQTMGNDHSVVIEDDQPMSINNNGPPPA